MKTLTSYLFLLTILLLQGCIQAPSNTRKSSLASSATAAGAGSKTPNTSYPTFATNEDLYWYTSSKIIGTVTINKNSQDVVYLRGKSVHDFLNSKDLSGVEYYRKQYCMVGNFWVPPIPPALAAPYNYKQIRVRAIPVYVTTSSKAIERVLRVDVPSSAENSSACNNTTIGEVLPANASFSLPGICTSTTTCTGQVTTKNLNLYEAKTLPASLTKIESTKLSLSAVLIRVDLLSNATDSSSSCTNSACEAKGFDCCISGQCVKDASEKTNASTDPQYAQAKLDYAVNPLSFINYPNIYYICSNIAHTPPASTGGSTNTPISDAEKRVYQYASDWKCISDYAANGANVFYVHKTNNTFVSSLSGLNATLYNTVTCNETYYTATKKKLAIACGCTATDSDMAIKCPDWGVVPVYKSGALQTIANITDFTCYIPAPANPIGPITNLNVSVPNRSAPHRFYSSTGVNYDDLTALATKSPSLLQEGEDFYYIDEYNKMGPVNGLYNINSVIGRMTIDLNHVVPAKQITVELGKSYILSATSGYFTPCSKCAKDSWFQVFSSHPNTQRGVGLQASGYTTSRDTYSANTTFGNYEDTKFGRACYVPVTMLAFAHQKNSNLQVQRQNRLKTQAALYINGYQRDWYGFNHGALIGSFDGVTWFAVGTGRRATATSTKLYLALNASFLDLADKTDTIVNIIPDFSANTASDYDYDPEIKLTDPRQNTAATCQRFHQCSTDADCVTQLGWEYACADVSQLKTKWPVYDSDAKETANQELTGSLFDILQNTISTSNPKKCVYRGAGAPCKRDYSDPATLSEFTRKGLICAPNFYCASLTLSKFNEELVRSPNELDDILFGMDTNILGRPLNYVTASRPLTTEIISNIKYNATSAIGLTTQGDDMGICRPGRKIAANDVDSHSNPDLSKRTDYISQVGSCDSLGTNTTSEYRYVTCPAFGDDLNYVTDSNYFDLVTEFEKTDLQQMQNSCGGEAKHTVNTDPANSSAFSSIEGLSLLNLQNITQPLLARDACFRRAGSICHTDLDCGPNKLHEQTVGAIDLKYFGETQAEQSYWKESLVCGQGNAIPALGTSGYFDYNLSQNRCCREIGKDFTMNTQGPKSIIPDNTGTNDDKLMTSIFPRQNPAAKYRYSRYEISKNAKIHVVDEDGPSRIPKVEATVEPEMDQWKVINETGSLTCCGGGWIRKFADGTHDWKVKNRLTIDASNFSCLNFRSPLADSAYNSFTTDKVVEASYQRESEYFCKSPLMRGCMQVEYPKTEGFTIYSPEVYNPEDEVAPDPDTNTDPSPIPPPSGAGTQKLSQLNTSPSGELSSYTQTILNADVPYLPLPYYYSSGPYDVIDGKANNFFTEREFDYGVEMYLPAYIGWDGTFGSPYVAAVPYDAGPPEVLAAPAVPGTPPNPTFIKKVAIKYFYDTPQTPRYVDITDKVALASECTAVIDFSSTTEFPVDRITTTVANPEAWCIVKNAKTQNRPVIIVKAKQGDDTIDPWTSAGIIIDFLPIEEYRRSITPSFQVTKPGNTLYYLSKLARLELIGIPQITYEPLYCNNDSNKLVPGIFTSAITNRSDFIASSLTYTKNELDSILRYTNDNDEDDASAVSTDDDNGYGNWENKFTFQNKLDHAAIFSSKDFTCCTPLGKTTTSAAKCCSGYATTNSAGTISTCKLPKGTDLNVYFNKFVSSEGVANLPAGISGLVVSGTAREIDFNSYTGEPKFRNSTHNKLLTLGAVFCDGGKVAQGAASGAFPPEPFSGSYTVVAGGAGNLESFPLSIVDSVLDFEENNPNSGKIPFDSGYKWNHHYYCK